MEFWSVQRLEEYDAVLRSGRHSSPASALREYGEAYGRKLHRSNLKVRFLEYFGVAPAARLLYGPDVANVPPPEPATGQMRPTAVDPLDRHGFDFSSPETPQAPTPEPRKVPSVVPDSGIGYTSLAFLADVHLDPDAPPHPSWQCAKRFVADKQPDVIVLGGDFLHMASLSHWDLSKRGLVEGRRYAEDVALANRELDELQEANPSAEYHFLEGNHEAWCRRYVEQYPELTGHMGLQKDLHLDERGIRWTAENGVLKVGKMRYIHGWYHNMHHAKKTVEQMGASVMYGHVHKPQSYTRELVERGQLTGYSVGCLCGLAPRYRRGQPTNWLNGFGWVEYREGGEFQASTISIVSGKMTFGGESWAG